MAFFTLNKPIPHEHKKTDHIDPFFKLHHYLSSLCALSFSFT
ncbi:hypothetical protein CHCC14821_1293 [Bacillus paralicheniformis]|nr:hypothetical protein CHCC14821_1293 [Bacillus paralicheniformis]